MRKLSDMITPSRRIVLLSGVLAIVLSFRSPSHAGDDGYAPPEKEAALAAVRANMAEAAKSQAEISVWMFVGGARQKVHLTSADESTLALKMENGKEVIQPWSKLGGEDFAALAKAAALGNGRWLLAVADYDLAAGDLAHADELMKLASRADPALREEVAKRSAFLDRQKATSGKGARGIPVKVVELVRQPANKIVPPVYAAVAAPNTQVVIPSSRVAGGVGIENNAKSNPKGGYFSVFDKVGEFKYPDTHANQLGKTAMVNDHCYWDSSPGGLDATHSGGLDPAGGNSLWWPVPTEWAAYELNVAATDTYTVMARFSSSWGPSKPVVIHITIDGVSSGPITLKPDDPQIWTDRYYLVGDWWGHTMTNCTSPVGWKLPAGLHLLKVFIDSFPEKSADHGNVWIHYFKVVKAGTPVGIVPPRAPGAK